MAGLFTPPDDIMGAVSELLDEHGIYNVVMMQHEPPVVYIQKCQCLISIDGQSLTLRRITDVDTQHTTTQELQTFDLSEPDSLDRLVEAVCKLK